MVVVAKMGMVVMEEEVMSPRWLMKTPRQGVNLWPGNQVRQLAREGGKESSLRLLSSCPCLVNLFLYTSGPFRGGSKIPLSQQEDYIRKMAKMGFLQQAVRLLGALPNPSTSLVHSLLLSCATTRNLPCALAILRLPSAQATGVQYLIGIKICSVRGKWAEVGTYIDR